MASPQRPVRVALIGANFASQVHAPAFRMDSRTELVGIAARSYDKARAVAASLSIPHAFGGWHQLLESVPLDAIAIAVPPSVQGEVAEAALSRHIAVFAEKPLAATVEQASALTEHAAAAGVANMIDFTFTAIPAWTVLRNALREELIGTLRHAVVTWQVETRANRDILDSWKTRIRSGGGTLYNFVAHTLHYLEWLCGPIGGLSCRLFGMRGDRRVTDTLDVLAISFISGVSASVSIGTASVAGSGHRLELYGSRGSLVLENQAKDYARGFSLKQFGRDGVTKEVFVPHAVEDIEGDGRVLPVATLTHRLIDWVLYGKPAEPDFSAGLRVQQLLRAAEQSNAEGRWIESKEF